MKKMAHATSEALLFVLLSTIGAAQAGLLGVQPEYPRIDYDNDGTTVLTAGALSIDAAPTNLVFTSGGAVHDVFPVRDMKINITVDASCAVTGGIVGDDLLVIGDVYDSAFTLVKSGILLTGEIIEMGAGPHATGQTTHEFDFRFMVTGGLLITDGDWPTDGFNNPLDAAVKLTVENSSAYGGNCGSDFGGKAKGLIGPETVTDPVGDGEVGTGTPGYWRNHLEAWPATITVGGVIYDPASDAHNLMSIAPKGDKTWNMFRQLTAAILNVDTNMTNDSCLLLPESPNDIIADADAWLVAHPVGSMVRAKDDAWSLEGDMLHETLDSYNNGLLCAPSRDTLEP